MTTWKLALIFTAILSSAPALAATDASGSLPGNVISGLERGILKYTNDHRAALGIATLSESSSADQFSRSYSQEMVQTGLFSHTQADGTTFEKRIASASLCGSEACAESAENIYEIDYRGLENFLPSVKSDEQIDALAKEIVDGWIASPGHRRNIEDPLLEEIGVGVSVSDKGVVYATQDFIRHTALSDQDYQQLKSVPHTEELPQPDPAMLQQQGIQPIPPAGMPPMQQAPAAMPGVPNEATGLPAGASQSPAPDPVQPYQELAPQQ